MYVKNCASLKKRLSTGSSLRTPKNLTSLLQDLTLEKQQQREYQIVLSHLPPTFLALTGMPQIRGLFLTRETLRLNFSLAKMVLPHLEATEIGTIAQAL